MQVSGDATEEQLLISLQTYYKRERIVERALASLFSSAESGHIRRLHSEIVQVWYYSSLLVFFLPSWHCD